MNTLSHKMLTLLPPNQVHVRSESLAVKISQEVNYAKSLYYEQQLMLPPSENEDSLLLDSWSNEPGFGRRLFIFLALI